MKITLYSFLIICLISSCVNSSEEPTIECGRNNLSLEVLSSVKANCDTPGSVTLSAQAEGDATPFTYSSNGVDFQASNVLENLSAGNLELSVKDANGCIETISFVLEAEDGSLSLALATTASNCVDDTGTITATASGGSGEYSYTLDGGAANSTGSFSDVSPGSHEVAVADTEGCSIENSLTIESESNVSLVSDISPLVQTNCAISGCHNGSVSPNLTTSAAIISSAERIKVRTGNGSMPRGGTLTSTQIKQIACWVDAGANDN